MELENILYDEANAKIRLGDELKKSLAEFEGIGGVSKVLRKIQQEIKFLEKVRLLVGSSH